MDIYIPHTPEIVGVIALPDLLLYITEAGNMRPQDLQEFSQTSKKVRELLLLSQKNLWPSMINGERANLSLQKFSDISNLFSIKILSFCHRSLKSHPVRTAPYSPLLMKTLCMLSNLRSLDLSYTSPSDLLPPLTRLSRIERDEPPMLTSRLDTMQPLTMITNLQTLNLFHSFFLFSQIKPLLNVNSSITNLCLGKINLCDNKLASLTCKAHLEHLNIESIKFTENISAIFAEHFKELKTLTFRADNLPIEVYDNLLSNGTIKNFSFPYAVVTKLTPLQYPDKEISIIDTDEEIARSIQRPGLLRVRQNLFVDMFVDMDLSPT